MLEDIESIAIRSIVENSEYSHKKSYKIQYSIGGV